MLVLESFFGGSWPGLAIAPALFFVVLQKIPLISIKTIDALQHSD